jgi:vancomycin permeability regulator SanA
MISRLLVPVGTAAGLTGATAAVSASVKYVRSFASGHLFSVGDVPWAPVGLVLGARVYPDGSPSSFLRGRLDLARILLASGKIERILVSGDHAAKEFDEPAAMRRYLWECGVPEHKIVVDPHGYDTYASCLRARDVYDVTGLTAITQTYHLPRAVGTARALGLDAAGVGDRSVSFRRRAWAQGVIRDQLACVKTVADLRRDRRRTGSARAG